MFIKWLLTSFTEHLPLLLRPSPSHPHSPLLNITVWNFPYRGKFFLIICYFGHTNNYNTLHLHFITIISNYWLLNGKLGFALTAGKAYFTKSRSNNTFKIYRFGIFYNVKSFFFLDFLQNSIYSLWNNNNNNNVLWNNNNKTRIFFIVLCLID